MDNPYVMRPCPFCGGPGDVSQYTRPGNPAPAGHYVECQTCGASGAPVEIQGEAPDRSDFARRKAVDEWNTRHG